MTGSIRISAANQFLWMLTRYLLVSTSDSTFEMLWKNVTSCLPLLGRNGLRLAKVVPDAWTIQRTSFALSWKQHSGVEFLSFPS